MLPIISCIISNYNTDPEMFRSALDSILNQTFRDFELILIDDKSTNQESRNVVEEYANKDDRIVPVYNDENKGLAGSLNVGLKLARGEYIARFDTDDICVKERFQRQLEYMRKNEVDICSTFAHLFGDYEGVVSSSFTSCEKVSAQLLFTCYIYHTPIMMKRSFLLSHDLTYDVQFDGAEDFDLFSRCREAGARICIMPEIMFHYRLHSNSVCHTQNLKQARLSNGICKRQMDNMGIKYNPEEWDCHRVLCGLEKFTLDKCDDINSWCEKLVKFNNKSSVFNKVDFAQVVYNRFFTAVVKSNYSACKRISIILRNKNLRAWSNLYAVIYKKTYSMKYKLKEIVSSDV